uniref:Uncharacterized protein n=1 Tax=Oryza rufipogon TaxID=4529 RepID=A0A0E0P4J3_ORYRU
MVGEDPETRMKGQEGHLRVQPVGAIAGESQAVAICALPSACYAFGAIT